MGKPADDEPAVRVRDTATLRGEAWIIVKRWGIDDRESRLALAEWILRRDVESWNDLRRVEWMRLVDALRGWEAVKVMRVQAGLESVGAGRDPSA
jgi:hypothetical protein